MLEAIPQDMQLTACVAARASKAVVGTSSAGNVVWNGVWLGAVQWAGSALVPGGAQTCTGRSTPASYRAHSGVAVCHSAMQSQAHTLARKSASLPNPGAHRLQSPVVGLTAVQRTGLSQRPNTRGRWNSRATCTNHLPELAHHTASCQKHCTVRGHASPANPVSQR